jgi:hypothetical protein
MQQTLPTRRRLSPIQSLFTVSLMTLADDLSAAEGKQLITARDSAVNALH